MPLSLSYNLQVEDFSRQLIHDDRCHPLRQAPLVFFRSASSDDLEQYHTEAVDVGLVVQSLALGELRCPSNGELLSLLWGVEEGEEAETGELGVVAVMNEDVG